MRGVLSSRRTCRYHAKPSAFLQEELMKLQNQIHTIALFRIPPEETFNRKGI